MLAQGMTRDQILAHYVEIYGTRILVEPPRRGFNLIAYWMPWIVLVVGLGAIVVFARRARPPEKAVTAAAPPADPGLDPYRRRVREELRRLDS